MARFNNAMGNGMGPGRGRGTGGGQGPRRGTNCRGNGLGFGAANTTDFGQGPMAQRNPGFFRRFCLGLTDQPGTASNARVGRILSTIDDLQRQIDALKNSTEK